jgi:hypothetical protein
LFNVLGFLCLDVLFFALPKLRAEKIVNRNFAIETCYATTNEINLAEQPARSYWAKHAASFGSNSVYLAVEADFAKRVPGTMAETDKLEDDGEFLLSGNNALLDFRDQILNHNQHEQSKVIRYLSESPFDHRRSGRLFCLHRHGSAK